MEHLPPITKDNDTSYDFEFLDIDLDFFLPKSEEHPPFESENIESIDKPEDLIPTPCHECGYDG